MSLGRRELLRALAAFGAALSPELALALPGAADAGALEPLELVLPGDPKLARRCLLLVPRAAPPKRLLVLCHGLGETTNERLGVSAWSKLYGLSAAFERLLAPPVQRVLPGARYFTDEHLATLNAELAQRPFEGLAIACPFTPNVYEAVSKLGALNRYADWIGDTLLPELRQRLGLALAPHSVALDGVSLGGYVSLEVFLRRPELFGAAGCVQGAIRTSVTDDYARRLAAAFAKVGPRTLRIATSSNDPFRPPSERLVKRLRERGVGVTLSITPGPHSQTWLREVGSLELLHFYDRTLKA
jgi:pimeloyl-ACP methyl ester carboxylesterase